MTHDDLDHLFRLMLGLWLEALLVLFAAGLVVFCVFEGTISAAIAAAVIALFLGFWGFIGSLYRAAQRDREEREAELEIERATPKKKPPTPKKDLVH